MRILRFPASMRPHSRLIGTTGFLTMLALSVPAAASELGSNGRLQFSADAIKTYGFESDADLTAQGAATLTWATGQYAEITPTPATAASLATSIISDPTAIEGGRYLQISTTGAPGFSIADPATFQSVISSRIEVSMWGRAVGAEPTLLVTYSHDGYGAGPFYVAEVTAIRTGRETSDGWVEYSTGPIDGSIWGHRIQGLYLTAHVAPYTGDVLLIDYDNAPQENPKAMPSWKAQIDGIEVRPSPGALVSGTACDHPTEASVCGAEATCVLGSCIDAAFLWGPAPIGAGHEADLVARLTFVMQHLHGARNIIKNGTSVLSPALSALATAAGPQELFAAATAIVSQHGNNGHTGIGFPPSYATLFYPFAYDYSSGLGACFGIVENDIAGDSKPSYVIRSKATQGYLISQLAVGDVLTSIDGMEPDAWLDEVSPSHSTATPDDPGQLQATRANFLADMIAKYATSIVTSRCVAGGTCTERPAISIAATLADEFEKNSSLAGGNSLSCAQRWTPAVPSAPSTYDDYQNDSVASAVDSGITSIQFDGFEPATLSAWETNMASALGNGGPYLFDARMGHGGRIDLGKWFIAKLRDNTNPAAGFAMPRGSVDDPDPSWIFDASWDACYDDSLFTFDNCEWGSEGSFGTTDTAAATQGAKIAWLDTLDVSMNDVIPKLIQGLPNVRIFGPSATSGSFGEISSTPPMMSNWYNGSIQVTDIRFGSTPADSRTKPWQSGTGVIPDQVVVQTLSDLLAGQDTIVNAARAWLVMP